ncbi:MAG TPA: hypothetical protein VLV15_07470, partial [Dongiaceae bacterium]|nr:hypothetical protein [Dongiaceae bacterium]
MSRRALVPIGITLLILALAAGCRIGALGSLERSAPMPSAPASPLAAMHGRSFYPLDLGNRWHYVRTFSSTWVDELGTPQEFNVTSALERELRCETALGARSYMAERTLEVAPNGTYLSWVYYRQDRNGLYEADDPTPPPCDSPPPPEETGPGLHAVALSSIAEPGRLP